MGRQTWKSEKHSSEGEGVHTIHKSLFSFAGQSLLIFAIFLKSHVIPQKIPFQGIGSGVGVGI